MSKIEIEIGTNEDANMIREEIELDIQAEDLNVTLATNSQGNIEASGGKDQVRQLVANPEFIERFFGGKTLAQVLALITD